MLPKIVYGKVMGSLKKMRTNWEQDRVENPNTVPYEIDISLRHSIETHMREGGVSVNRHVREQMIDEAFEYLVKQGTIVKSPYGGHMFPLPEGTTLPTREEFIETVKKTLGNNP
jgi:hypothetical protein